MSDLFTLLSTTALFTLIGILRTNENMRKYGKGLSIPWNDKPIPYWTGIMYFAIFGAATGFLCIF